MFCQDKYNSQLPICLYVKILIKEDQKKTLSPIEIRYKQRLVGLFGSLNIERYREFYLPPNEKGFIEVKNILKESYTEIRAGAIKAHNPDKGKNYSAFLEFLKALKYNVDFSFDDPKNKAPKYNEEKDRELFELVKNFHGTTYRLNEEITIRLTPKEFIHIVIGHLDGYQIPRKGKIVTFEFLHHWENLLAFIKIIIDDIIKDDLIVHYNNTDSEYSNRNIKICDKQYGIHIGRRKNIKTFYQIM
ncbi:hypothetical protein GCM10027516_11080 [Niabella aquatica]